MSQILASKGKGKMFMFPSSVPTAKALISKRFDLIWHKDNAG